MLLQVVLQAGQVAGNDLQVLADIQLTSATVFTATLQR
jgi:hypothetical protein